MMCTLFGHRWPRWKFDGHYIDRSLGGKAWSSMFVRECRRCGLVKMRPVYGITYRPEVNG